MGSSLRMLLSEGFNNKLFVHLGFLEEVINGPLHFIVTFVRKEFVRLSANLSKVRTTLSGDIFIIVMMGSLKIDVYSRKSEETESERTVLFFTMDC